MSMQNLKDNWAAFLITGLLGALSGGGGSTAIFRLTNRSDTEIRQMAEEEAQRVMKQSLAHQKEIWAAANEIQDQKFGKVLDAIENVNNSVQDVKTEQRQMKAQVQDTRERVIRLESSN